MNETKVTRNYQITIPRKIRERLGVKMGDKVEFRESGSEVSVILKPVEKAVDPLESGVLDGAYERLFGKRKISTDEIVRRLRGDWEE